MDEEKTARPRIEKMIPLPRSLVVICFCEEARRELLLKTAPCTYIYPLH